MGATLARLDATLGRRHGPDRLETAIGAGRTARATLRRAPRRRRRLGGRNGPGPALHPARRSVALPLFRAARGASARARARGVAEVEYFGDRYAQFRVQYASTDRPRKATASTRPRSSAGSRGRGPPPLPPRPLPAARLRRYAHPEPGRVLPDRVPAGGSRLAGNGTRWQPPEDAHALPGGGPAARAAQDARPLLPDQLPLHRDHQRLQLQVHVVPGRDHGPPPRLHEEGEGLPAPRRGRGEALLARARSTP